MKGRYVKINILQVHIIEWIFTLLMLMSISCFMTSCLNQKAKAGLSKEQILDIADELAPKVMAEQDKNLSRIQNLLKLIEKDGVQTEYEVSTAGPNNLAKYTEPKQHKNYTNEYDFSRILFLFCNDKDSLQNPHKGKCYNANNFVDYNLSTLGAHDVSRMKWTLELCNEEAIKDEIVSQITRRQDESSSNLVIEDVKYKVINAIDEFMSRIERFDLIVFIHLTSYLDPTFSNLNPKMDNFSFYGGQMDCQAIVGDIETGKVVSKITFKNANNEDLNFYYTKKEGSSIQNYDKIISSMKKSMHDDLMNTMLWRLQELLVKHGIVPKKSTDN